MSSKEIFFIQGYFRKTYFFWLAVNKVPLKINSKILNIKNTKRIIDWMNEYQPLTQLKNDVENKRIKKYQQIK